MSTAVHCPVLSALELCSDVTSVFRQLKRSRNYLPFLGPGSSHTHLNVMCRSIFATMAVTVRMRSVARPYTVHPASVKHRGECAQGVSFGLGVSCFQEEVCVEP